MFDLRKRFEKLDLSPAAALTKAKTVSVAPARTVSIQQAKPVSTQQPKANYSAINQGLNSGRSWEDISRQTGTGLNTVKSYSQQTRPNYGISGPKVQSAPKLTMTQPRQTLTIAQPKQPTMQMSQPKLKTPSMSMGTVQTPKLTMAQQAMTPERTRQNKMYQGFKQGLSFEDIARNSGNSMQEVQKYKDSMFPTYGDKGAIGNIANGIGDLAKGMWNGGKGLVTRPFTDATDLNRQKGEAELQQINKDFQSGAISPDAAMERASTLAGKYTTQKAYQDKNGWIRVGNQNVGEFAGNIAQQGLDTSNLLPVAGGVLSGAAKVAQMGGKTVLANTLGKGAGLLTGGTTSLATSKLAQNLASRGMNSETARIVGNAITSNAKQAAMYGTLQTGSDVLNGRGVTPESLAANYGGTFAMGVLPDIGIPMAARGIKTGVDAIPTAHKTAIAHPLVQEAAMVAKDKIARRQALLDSGVSPNNPQVVYLTKGIAADAAEYNRVYKRVVEQAQGQLEGGFQQVPFGKKPDAPLNPKSVDPTAALKAEALKYKTAEEFANSKINSYHQTDATFDKFENMFEPFTFSNAHFFSNRKPDKLVLKNLVEAYTDLKNPLVLDDGNITQPMVDKAIKDGYDGIINSNSNGTEVAVFNPDEILTRKQLTDLYNQAHTPQPKPEVAQAKVEVPKQPTPFEKSLEQAGIVPKKTEAPKRPVAKETPLDPIEADYINETAARYSSPEQFLNETVDRIWRENKNGKGVDFQNNDGGIRKISNNTPLYRAFNDQYGMKPTKTAVRDMVEQRLAGKSGEFNDLLDETALPSIDTAVYKQLKERADAANGLKDTTDYSLAFEKDLQKAGIVPSQPIKTQAKQKALTVKAKASKETAVSREGSLKLGENKPRAVGDASTYTQLNTNRIDLSKEAKSRIAKETSEVVKKLSNNEIKDMAKSAGIDFKSYGVEGTRKKITEQLNVRNEIFTIEKQIETARKAGNKELQVELMQKSAELGRISRSQGTDLGRQLQARRIIADSLATPQQKLYRLFDEAGVDPEVYTKRMADVDMTKPNEVVKAYRDLVPAKFSDWLDKYRYTNMLSSPLTHIVNITSNLSGLGGIAPVQKLVEGAIDATRSAVTGAQRTRFASEAGSYVAGAVKSVPEAVRKFRAIMSGKQAIDMPDADALKYGKLANKGVAGVADSVFSVIPKLLEASDQFGMTLVKGGEKAGLQKRMSKGVAVAKDVTGLIEDKAKYRLFRQELNASGQGHLLDAVDFIPSMILQARNSKNKVVSTIAKFTIPFVTTPTNLFKQGIEYSPAGLLTLSGNSDKVAQLAKMTMGTSVMAVAAATLASQDAISFSEPSDAKQRDAFRAEGKQPYSIKVGDKWIQYSKLHPAIAFNLALVGGTKDALDKGAIDQPTADKVLSVGGGILGFFRDQSYMKSLGDFTSALEMKDGAQLEDSIGSVGSNWANQLVPFKSMTSWVGRMVDPTQRKIDYTADAPTQIYQNMVKDIPGLNKNVPTRNNPYYKDQDVPLENPNPILNSFSPLRVSNDLGYGNTTGLNMTERREMSKMPDADKESFRVNSINQKYLDKVAKEKNSEGSTASTTKNTGKPDTGWTDEYNAAKSAYQKDSKNWTEIQRIGKEKELRTLDVKKNFSKDATRLYDMAEKDIYAYLDKSDDKKASDYLNQVVAYGDQMVEAGLWSTNKLRDKNGNVQYKRGYTGSTGGSRTTSRSSSAKTGSSSSSTKKGKFDYKLNMFSDSTRSSGSAADLYALLKKATMKG